MSALCFVPGIAADAIIPPSDVGDRLNTFVDHSSIEHQGRGGVLESCHHLGVVGEWNFGPYSFAVIANHHGRFVIKSEGALHAIVKSEAWLMVVLVNRVQRL